MEAAVQHQHKGCTDLLVVAVSRTRCYASDALFLLCRDLKAENVLRSGEGPNSAWVICDFGSATSRAKVYDTALEMATEEDNIRRTTTPAYRAPEVSGI